MKILLLVLILFSFGSFANGPCNITTYDQIIKINKNQDDTIIKDSNCSGEIEQSFIDFIESANGKLQADYLAHYFKTEYNIDLTILPKTIAVSHIKDIIQEKIKNKNAVVKSVTSLMPQASILLSQTENIHIDCKNCDTAGTKNISLGFKGQTYWLNTLIHLKRKSFVLSKNVMTLNEKLESDYFQEKTILDSGSKMLFEDIDNIRFYQLTRYLKKGDILNRSDLTPRTLVQYGQKIKLQYKSKNIQLDSTAIASGNGKFGDFIQVMNPRSKKKVLAKIIDYNKVEVEL